MILLSFVAVSFTSTRIVGGYLIEQLVSEQQRQVETLSGDLAPYLYNYDAQNLFQVTVDKGHELNGRVLVLSGEGVVLSESFSQMNGMKLDHKEVLDVLAKGGTQYGFHKVSVDTAASDGETKQENIWVAYYATPIAINEQRIGVLLFLRVKSTA